MVTDCSGERSFSLLRRLKIVYRFNISQKHFSEIVILSVESEVAKTLDLESIVHDFVSIKVRKKMFLNV